MNCAGEKIPHFLVNCINCNLPPILFKYLIDKESTVSGYKMSDQSYYIYYVFCDGCQEESCMCSGEHKTTYLWNRANDIEKSDPCPFCLVKYVQFELIDNTFWCVVCDDCHTKGPRSDAKRDALVLWNRIEDIKYNG
jgi:hypothetical protein